MKKISSLPIFSLDSHDYAFCDFNCKDCLAVDTRNWAEKELGFTYYNPDEYEKALLEIARYSKARGCDSIRFEMSGEGNPDMYPFRERIIRFAKEKCNMQIVYISSGSRLTDNMIDALAQCADYVRISLPGATEQAYEIYSGQLGKQENKFTYSKAMELIRKLVAKRKEYGREGELLIGARTCLRHENEGGYLKTAKFLGKIGADSFQIVKILVPSDTNLHDNCISEKTKEELLSINKQSTKLMHVQVPPILDYLYYGRELDDDEKPSQCYSSMISPILYGPHLVICTHWEKIKDIKNSHYGKITGENEQLEKLMHDVHAKQMRESVPKKCTSCCAIYDNLILESIRSQLVLAKDIQNIDFYLVY